LALDIYNNTNGDFNMPLGVYCMYETTPGVVNLDEDPIIDSQVAYPNNDKVSTSVCNGDEGHPENYVLIGNIPAGMGNGALASTVTVDFQWTQNDSNLSPGSFLNQNHAIIALQANGGSLCNMGLLKTWFMKKLEISMINSNVCNGFVV
jgi:hypothetical protein